MKRAMKAVLLAVTGSLVGGAGAVAYLSSRTVEAPYPDVVADTSPEGVARGAFIFNSVCQECHKAPGAERAVGQHLAEVPAFLGTFHSANLTRHPTAGIGAASDRELARIIRYGVTRDGRMSLMGMRLGDADLAAVLGFLRSGDARLEADPTVQPRSRLSPAGRAIFVLSGLSSPPELPAHIPVPPREDARAYGEYLAHAVLDCAACHTAGFSREKGEGPGAFAGGFEMTVTGTDEPINTPNLTFDATGLAGWTEAQLGTAVREGLRPDGQPLFPPMPRFRELTDADVHALYTYLQSLPPRPLAAERVRPVPLAPARPAAAQAAPAPAPVQDAPYVPDAKAAAALGNAVIPSTVPLAVGQAAAPAQATAPAEPDGAHLFDKHGCVTCHGPGAVFHDKLAGAKGKSVEQVAQWIRTPQAFKPGTQMPAYANQVSEAQARVLAAWVLAGTPGDAKEQRASR
jgi:mono/diheme cytochrome c family protein